MSQQISTNEKRVENSPDPDENSQSNPDDHLPERTPPQQPRPSLWFHTTMAAISNLPSFSEGRDDESTDPQMSVDSVAANCPAESTPQCPPPSSSRFQATISAMSRTPSEIERRVNEVIAQQEELYSISAIDPASVQRRLNPSTNTRFYHFVESATDANEQSNSEVQQLQHHNQNVAPRTAFNGRGSTRNLHPPVRRGTVWVSPREVEFSGFHAAARGANAAFYRNRQRGRYRRPNESENAPPDVDILETLARVSLWDIRAENLRCDICYVDIGTTQDNICESGVRMPCCKKCFGEFCIKKWLQMSNTCPNCRKVLFIRTPRSPEMHQPSGGESSFARRLLENERYVEIPTGVVVPRSSSAPHTQRYFRPRGSAAGTRTGGDGNPQLQTSGLRTSHRIWETNADNISPTDEESPDSASDPAPEPPNL